MSELLEELQGLNSRQLNDFFYVSDIVKKTKNDFHIAISGSDTVGMMFKKLNKIDNAIDQTEALIYKRKGDVPIQISNMLAELKERKEGIIKVIEEETGRKPGNSSFKKVMKEADTNG